MDWQRQVLDVGLEVDADGKPVYRSVVFSVPRQSGKSTLMLAVAVWMARTIKRAQVVYSAQTGAASRQRIRDWGSLLLDTGHATNVHLSNGNERIELDASRILAVSNSVSSGHGLTVDGVMYDEIFSWKDDRLIQALRPAMITRPAAQAWLTSTAGDAESVVWHRMMEEGRERCLTNTHGRTAYFEWSADPAADPADPATWQSCMPALSITVDPDVIAAEFDAMPLSEFKRAYLNLPTVSSSQLFPPGAWEACASTDKLSGPLHLSVDSFEGESSIALADRHLAVVVASRPGTGWVVDEIVRLRSIHQPRTTSLDGGSQSRLLLPELERRIGRRSITVLGTADVCDASALLMADVVEGRFRHGSQPVLTDAAAAAVRRPVGDRWALGRKRSTSPITSLVAVSLAHFMANRKGGDLDIANGIV